MMPLIAFAGVITVISTILFLAHSPSLNIIDLLKVVDSNPRGIVTGIFVHANAGHLVLNLIMLWMLVILAFFVLRFSSLDKSGNSQRIWMLITASLIAAISINVLWLIFINDRGGTGGISGLNFAFAGIIIMISVMNARRAIHRKQLLTKYSFKRLIAQNGVIALSIFPLLYFGAGLVRSAEGNANDMAHLGGFLLGAVAAAVFELAPRKGSLYRA